MTDQQQEQEGIFLVLESAEKGRDRVGHLATKFGHCAAHVWGIDKKITILTTEEFRSKIEEAAKFHRLTVRARRENEPLVTI